MLSDVTPTAGLPSDLEEAKIASLPEAFYYIADFITEEEERMLLDKVRASEQSKAPRVMQYR